MKKNSKKATKQIASAQLSVLAEREAQTLCVGIDLGDRVSTYCVRELKTEEVLAEGTVGTSPGAMLDQFRCLKPQRMVMETGTHARWIAELLRMMGHEVIVGNARKLKLITERFGSAPRSCASEASSLRLPT